MGLIGRSDNDFDEVLASDETVKMFLFGRWISTLYADVQVDDNGLSENEEGFDSATGLSSLNNLDGDWWKGKLEHYNKFILPIQKANGSFDETKRFLV